MSRAPFTQTTGVASLRATLFKQLDLVAEVGAQLGFVSDQYARLGNGQAVTFSTSQLRSFFPLGTEHPSLPPDLGAANAWTLTDDNTLSPA